MRNLVALSARLRAGYGSSISSLHPINNPQHSFGTARTAWATTASITRLRTRTSTPATPEVLRLADVSVATGSPDALDHHRRPHAAADVSGPPAPPAALAHHRRPHAAADAERRGTAAAATRLERVYERREHARAAGADWMPECDRTAVDVDLGGIELQFAYYGERLSRERLVQLDDVEIVEGQVRTLHGPTHGFDGTHAHDYRVDSGRAVRQDPGERSAAVLRSPCLGRDHEGRRAVVDP